MNKLKKRFEVYEAVADNLELYRDILKTQMEDKIKEWNEIPISLKKEYRQEILNHIERLEMETDHLQQLYADLKS